MSLLWLRIVSLGTGSKALGSDLIADPPDSEVLAFCIGKSQPHDHAPPLAWINILDEQFWLLYHLNLNVP